MLAALTSTGLVYAATVGFYQAHGRRTTLPLLKQQPGRQTAVRWGSWLLLVLSTLVMARAFGWELGIPLVLGLVCAAGVLSLLCGEFMPRLHWPLGAAALGVGVVAGGVWLASGST